MDKNLSLIDDIVSNKDEIAKLFDNPLLDKMTQTNPLLLLIIYLPVIIYLIWHSSKQHSILSLLFGMTIGLFIWTFVEYIIHRFVFHSKPTSTWGRKLHFLTHGVHHAYPRDSKHLVMPLIVSIPLGIIFYFGFTFIFGWHSQTIFIGFLCGYLIYDLLHFAAHHFHFKIKYLKYLRQYHLKHHYYDSHHGFGVSNPIWDYVFQTKSHSIREKDH